MTFAIVFLLLAAAGNAQLPDDLTGLITQITCETLTKKIGEELLCNTANLFTCDTHCKCAHGAEWGECTENSASTSTLGSGDKYCACHYTPLPPGVSLPIDPTFAISCLEWKPIATVLCTNSTLVNVIDVPTVIPDCAVDCVCAHNAKNGNCPLKISGPCKCTY